MRVNSSVMSQPRRVLSQACRLAVALPALLLLCAGECGGSPLGLFSLFDPTGFVNGTSILGALALAHVEHTLAKISALATLAGLFANATQLAVLG